MATSTMGSLSSSRMPIGSVTRWLQTAGGRTDESAAELLWSRFGFRLVRLARHHLRTSGDHAYDEEDLALSTLFEFYERAANGDYLRLANRHDLWKMLAIISLNKSRNRHRDNQRIKRRRGEVEDVELDNLPSESGQSATWIAEVADEWSHLLRLLDLQDSTGVLKQITLLRLDGFSIARIARTIGCTRRTVIARLNWIQAIWQSYHDEQFSSSPAASGIA